jgi:Family of unknown function (DUF6010)
MNEHVVPELQWIDWLAPIAPALIFVVIMSLVAEPSRQRFNAIFVAGAGAAYLSGGLGIWEFVFTSIATLVAYKGLSSYRYIGIAWLMHSCWDAMHHLYGNPIIVFSPTSSAGCAVADAIIAIWFLLGAPSVTESLRRKPTTATHP